VHQHSSQTFEKPNRAERKLLFFDAPNKKEQMKNENKNGQENERKPLSSMFFDSLQSVEKGLGFLHVLREQFS